MIQIAVCEDEKLEREKLRSMLERYADQNGRLCTISEYSSATKLLADYRSQFDLLFLDISMDGLDGMTVAHEIRRLDSVVCMIFVTSMRQYAIEGYTVRAFGFLPKPLQYDDFSFTLDAALQQIDARHMAEDTIQLQIRGQIERLKVSDIYYCEVTNHSVSVHLRSGVKSYRIQMKDIEKMLARYGFFRPHSSFLVNHRAIEQIGSNNLLLTNGDSIPVSQHRRKSFLKELTSYLGETL